MQAEAQADARGLDPKDAQLVFFGQGMPALAAEGISFCIYI